MGVSQALKVITFDRRLRRALEGGRYDVIHGFTKTSRQDVYTDGSGCLIDFERATLPLRNPLARLLRRWGPHRYAVARMERERYGRGNSRKVIAMSRMAKEQIHRRYGLDGPEVEVLYNGVDIERFSPERRAALRGEARRDLGASDELILLFVGNDESRKGADLLVRGMGRVDRGAGPIRGVIAGKTRSPGALRSLAGSLGVPVDLLGPRGDIPRLLAAADLLVFPSRFDIFGMAVLEAMASAVPVIVSRAAGASEIVTHGESGWLVETEDPGGIAEGIRLLADPARREEMGRIARRVAERHSMERHVDRLVEIYREVAEAKRAGHREPAEVPG
jgi:UDP-glucose:(heptosyl)LPS alpha-1,3-glucosyltransferase